jgi:hypothetical protein
VKTIKIIAVIVGAGLLMAPAISLSAQAAVLTYQCTNTASQAKWTVTVDDQKKTADGFPAIITAGEITWVDLKDGGHYELDRKTGALTYANSSSMGGYLLWHHCQLAK